MCTLIIARNAFKFYPVVIAANRDEVLSRPSSPPKIWDGNPRMYAPVDELAGGTWIGASENGIIAAITNRADVPQTEGRESRGTLVLAALQAPSARSAASILSSLSGTMYNGFNLALLDRKEGVLLRGDGRTISASPIKDGVHVITQFGVGDDHCVRAARVGVRYRCYVRGAQPRPVAMDAMLAMHVGMKGIDGACVHVPEKGYGTRSSSIVRMSDDGKGVDWWHREGPACESKFGPPRRFDFRL